MGQRCGFFFYFFFLFIQSPRRFRITYRAYQPDKIPKSRQTFFFLFFFSFPNYILLSEYHFGSQKHAIYKK